MNDFTGLIGVSINGATPIAGWCILWKKPNLKWMTIGATPILGTIHMMVC